MPAAIVDLPFHPRHADEDGLGFEVLRLRALIGRAPTLDHRLDHPQRMGMHLALFVTEGRGRHVVDFAPYALEPGTLLVVGVHQVQEFDLTAPVEATLMVCTDAFFRRARGPYEAGALGPEGGPWGAAYLVRPERGDDTIRAQVARIEAEFRDGPRDALRAEVLGREFGLLLARAERARRRGAGTDAEPSTPLRAFLDLVERHFRERWAVAAYAEALGVSARTLEALTRRCLKRTPKAVLDARLALEVKRLLAHTDLPVKAIAYEMGFADPTNLAKFFRRVERDTPQAFRTRVRKAY